MYHCTAVLTAKNIVFHHVIIVKYVQLPKFKTKLYKYSVNCSLEGFGSQH